MDERVKLSYLQWQEKYRVEKPFRFFAPLPAGTPEESRTNLVFGLGDEEVIRDIRGSSANFTLDEQGFTICSTDTSLHPLSATEIINEYNLETCELVKKAMSAEFVVPFDWIVSRSSIEDLFPFVYIYRQIRKSTSPNEVVVFNLSEDMVPLPPTVHVHIGNGPSHLQKYITDHAPRSYCRQCETACQGSCTGRTSPISDR